MRFLRPSAALTALLTVAGLVTACGASASPARRAPAAVSAAECAANRAAGTITFVSPFEFDASAGILDVYAAQHLGYFTALCLRVAFNPNLTFASPYPLVSSGAATVTGEGSAADVLLQASNGVGFTAVATYGDTSDYALLTRAGISKLTQLAGKNLGYHTTLPVVITEMLQKAGVDPAKVHEVNDTSFDPTVLVHGPYQALQAYQSNEPFTLDAAGDAKDFRTWTPAELGVRGTFNVQVVNSRFLRAHRQAVADFLRAEFHAFDYCAAHAPACVGYVAAAAGKSYDRAHALKEWNYEVALSEQHTLSGQGVGVQSAAEWTPELQALVANKLVKKAPSLASAMDASLAASLYRGTQLIWP
ncbi:MAG TPA: ABC transporter substrate-binding protein [Acidimicrobiales bacterium]|nr:ABC transporter substrate-binding protein [Acidimicrobiales bacterium]